MKKAFALILALVLLVSVAACGRPAQPAAEKSMLRLFLPGGNADGFDIRVKWTDGSIEDVVGLLAAEGALPKGCAPLSFDRDSAALDMNTVFGTAVSSTGTTGEYLLFGSLVNTVLVFYGLESVSVTAEGRVIESGHAVYDEPLRFYENQVAIQ